MKGKRFSLFLSGISALGVFGGMLIMLNQIDRVTNQPGERALWMGAFFLVVFVLGFVALQLAMAIYKNYRVERPGLWWAAFLVTCVLIFGIGAGGQYLFMFSREEVVIPAEVDMVLLLDASGSMETGGYSGPRTDAACQFVDSLDESSRLQAVSFAGTVVDSTALLPADSANKDQLKQMIRTIDASGTTDFNEPLTLAMNTLNSQGRPNCNKAVILLTDGQSTLDSSVVDQYLNTDIRVFTIRISNVSSLTAEEQALVDFATNTKGFDAHLMPRSDGSIDTSAMLQAFKDAFDATSETNVNMRKGLIVCSQEGVTMWQFLIRVLVMVLCAVVIGFGYFRRISPAAVLSSAVMGLSAAVLVTALDGEGIFVCTLVTVLLIETPFVFLELRREDQLNV